MLCRCLPGIHAAGNKVNLRIKRNNIWVLFQLPCLHIEGFTVVPDVA